MASFTKSVGVVPYLGGTLSTSFQKSILVRLTSERMVWLHMQTDPNWIIGTVINTPGGVTSGSEPVVAAQQLVINGGDITFANRLTDNTFLILSQNYFCVTGTNFNNGTYPTSYWVCSIDDDNVITVIDQGSFAVIGGNQSQSFNRNNTIWTQTDIVGARTTGCFEIADNRVSLHNFDQAGWLYYTLRFDTTTGKLVAPNYTTPVADSALSAFSPSSSEWIRNSIPGRPDLTMITRRSCSGGTSFASMKGSLSAVFNSSGDIHMNTTATNSQLPSILPTASNNASNGYAALTPMPGNQMLATSLTNATIYSVDYTAKTWTQRTTGTFSAAPTTDDGFSRYVFALDANYWLIASRWQFYYPGPSMRWKIVRRYDNNFLEQSAASANNGRNGFTVLPAATTYMSPLCSHPEIINGKLFYWGHAGGTNSDTLSWTVYDI